MIDSRRRYLGEVDSVGAAISPHVDRSGIEPRAVNDGATLNLVTRSGAHAILPLDMAAHTGDQHHRIDLEIVSDEGSVEGRLVLFGSEGGGGDQKAFQTIHEERFQANFWPSNGWSGREGHGRGTERPDLFRPCVEGSAGPRALIDAIIENRPAIPDLHDGVAAQRLIDAAIRSQATDCRIEPRAGHPPPVVTTT